jgi:hypothetical protein
LWPGRHACATSVGTTTSRYRFRERAIAEEATSTHYEVLGVAPDASHDEVKRAYTDLALRYHPDRNTFTDDESRELAEYRMREINDAWAVLRNPATRAAYDAALRGERRPRLGERPAAPAKPTAAEQAPFPNATGDAADAAPPLRLGPVIFGVVLIACLLLVAFVAGVPRSSSENEMRVETRERFAVGSCVLVAPSEVGLLPVEVPCSTPDASRVVSRVDFPRPCPLGTTLVRVPGENIGLCLQ